jgi:uncharacterized protein (DUF1778 family)
MAEKAAAPEDWNILRTTTGQMRLLAAEHIVLSERDSERVLKLLDTLPKPTPALLAAARRARRR